MQCTVSRERVKWRIIEQDRRCSVRYPGSGLSGVSLSKIVGAVYGVPGAGLCKTSVFRTLVESNRCRSGSKPVKYRFADQTHNVTQSLYRQRIEGLERTVVVPSSSL